MDLPQIAAKIINLNSNKLVGKTRLQKTFYFLEELNAGFGLNFDYHHYGPYSEELNIAAEDAEDLELLNVEWKKTQAGTSYAVFSSNVNFDLENGDTRRIEILQILSRYDSVSIELAATADYLQKNGYSDDPWQETVIRKPEKSSNDRINRAKEILIELGRV